MAEEAAAVEADADAPMINVSEPEAPQEDAPIPVHEQPQEEMQSSDDDDGPLERPDYYPAKFWDEDGPDVEKLAKSYAELEKKFKSGKHKGGHVTVKVDEPSYIIGIISLTPRIDYSQGNKWDTSLKTMDDLHKPALDEIGFQELITEQMAWWSTTGS